MNTIGKVCVMALLLVGTAVYSAEAEPREPEIMALKFHADWCGSCKVMGSAFEELQAKHDTLPVLYLVLDHTRDYHRAQSEYLAASLGLDDIWSEHGGKTGFILLVDVKTLEVVGKLTKDQPLKEMGATLQQAVSRTNGA